MSKAGERTSFPKSKTGEKPSVSHRHFIFISHSEKKSHIALGRGLRRVLFQYRKKKKKIIPESLVPHYKT